MMNHRNSLFRDDLVRDSLFLVATLIILFGPFVIHGGFLRDDLGLLAYPPRTTTYRHYQALMSSQPVLTGRPVSALLLGVCGWTFGTTAWPYHLVNLTLFGTTVLLVFHALTRILPRRVAIMTACFAIVYPCAAGSVYSSTMMNSNLAGCCWAGSLLIATLPGWSLWRGPASAALLLLSALSYEAFVPLFLTTVLARYRVAPLQSLSWRGVISPIIPVVAALLLYGVYHAAIEPVLFGASYSRVSIPVPAELTRRLLSAAFWGTKVAYIDSLRITIKSIPYVTALPVATLLMPLLWLVVIGSLLVSAFSSGATDAPSPEALPGDGPQGTTAVTIRPGAQMPLIGCLVFLTAQTIFVFSDYTPQSWGFENRTQVGVRFAFAFLVAVLVDRLLRLPGKASCRWVAMAAIALLGSFFMAMVAQREAWIAAARFNDRSLHRVERAIRAHGLDRGPALTILTALPASFPGQLNHEPIFGVSWDIGAALSLAFPAIDIRANVPVPTRTVVSDEGVTIDRTWVATFPCHVYSDETESIQTISSSDEWRRLSTTPAVGGTGDR